MILATNEIERFICYIHLLFSIDIIIIVVLLLKFELFNKSILPFIE